MTRTFEILLLRLRDGDVRPGDLEHARALAAADDRVPPELRGEVFRSVTELEADAAGILAVLGLDDLGGILAEGIGAEVAELDAAAALAVPDAAWTALAAVLVEGIAAEAAGVDLAEDVVRRLPVAAFAHGGLVGSAVAGEAGVVELAGEVAAVIGAPSVPVADAVRALAGTVDVVDGVLAAIGAPVVDVAAAVRAEAGPVDVVADVMAAVGAWRTDAAPVEVRAAAAPANGSRWSFAGFALAASLLVSVVVSRYESPVVDPVPVVSTAHGAAVFAHAGEVVIEDLQYDAGVQVIQTEGEDGAVILWVDEEA